MGRQAGILNLLRTSASNSAAVLQYEDIMHWTSHRNLEYFSSPVSRQKKLEPEPSPYDFTRVIESDLTDASALCEPCRVLELGDLKLVRTRNRQGDWELEREDVNLDELDYIREDKVPALPDLAASAGAGCGFCGLLRNAMIKHFQQHPLHQLDDNTIRISHISHRWNRGLVAFTVHSPSFVSLRHGFDYLTFRISANWNDPCAKLFDITSDPIPGNVISPAGIFTMKKWVFAKEDKHDRDARGGAMTLSRPLFRPTRLIYVEGAKESSRIRLVECSSEHPEFNVKPQRYIALSYLWGADTPSLKATTDTLAHLKSSIPFNRLPGTYRDVVRVARAIGVNYIWIDALCIIQNDAADWQRESQMMADIYRNALVTIVPLCTKSCDDGFLSRGQSLKINYNSTLWGIKGSFYLRHIPIPHDETMSGLRSSASFSDGPLNLDLEHSPWPSRGWTFQEGMFSTRKLYFGNIMMHWDSLGPSAKFATEDGLIDDPRDHPESAMIHPDTRWRGLADYDEWYARIRNYGDRQLTYERDRLPAISSFARLLADKSGDDYLAGLWANDLHRGLLWKLPRHGRKLYRQALEDLLNPDPYIAPSWSWASRQAGVLRDRTDTMSPECEFVEAKLEGDRFGCVSSGHLLIRGRACKVPGGSLHKLPLQTSYYQLQNEWLILDDGKYVAQCTVDWRATDQGGRQLPGIAGNPVDEILMLLISSGHTTRPEPFCKNPAEAKEGGDSDKPVEVMHGLLLMPTSNADNEFWRIGVFNSLTEERGGRPFFDECVEQLVLLV